MLALVRGTIYGSPNAEPIRDGVVLIEGGKIRAAGPRRTVTVPRGAQTLDCSGLTITAGFWNSHVHFFQRKWANAGDLPAAELTRQLQDMLTRWGFTNVFDLGSPWENTRRIRERIESGEALGPRIRTTGRGGLTPPGVVPADQVLDVLGVMRNVAAPGVSDAAQAAAAARKVLEEGADGIKLHSLADEAIIRAAVEEAHRAGKPAFAHPTGGAAGLTAVVRGGVDIVAHTTPWVAAWDETLLAEMKQRRVAVIPTLQIWKYLRRHDRVSTQEQTVRNSTAQLRAWAAAGGEVLFGTDAGAVDDDPSEEYVLMAASGMTFRQILAALTTAPAERFGEAKTLGRVAAGYQADLVVLKSDPAKSVPAFASVQYTLRAGKIIYRAVQEIP
jgi:imidazolonepropionase-like amidohydrolase